MTQKEIAFERVGRIAARIHAVPEGIQKANHWTSMYDALEAVKQVTTHDEANAFMDLVERLIAQGPRWEL